MCSVFTFTLTHIYIDIYIDTPRNIITPDPISHPLEPRAEYT